jgi:hypothetical protein
MINKYQAMLINPFSKHIFWSYHQNADLPDRIIIEQVATYGEISDLITLARLYKKENIIDVIQNLRPNCNKRVNFILKVII